MPFAYVFVLPGLSVALYVRLTTLLFLLQDYEEGDECLLGHCGHGFHFECLSVSLVCILIALPQTNICSVLKSWLKDHGDCPICRNKYT